MYNYLNSKAPVSPPPPPCRIRRLPSPSHSCFQQSRLPPFSRCASPLPTKLLLRWGFDFFFFFSIYCRFSSSCCSRKTCASEGPNADSGSTCLKMTQNASSPPLTTTSHGCGCKRSVCHANNTSLKTRDKIALIPAPGILLHQLSRDSDHKETGGSSLKQSSLSLSLNPATIDYCCTRYIPTRCLTELSRSLTSPTRRSV